MRVALAVICRTTQWLLGPLPRWVLLVPLAVWLVLPAPVGWARLREEKTGSGLPAPTTPAPGLGAVANNNPTALVASPTTMMTSPQPSKLFVNLTSDEPWRAAMALRFARIYQERGILATVFLNVEGVNVATRNVTETQLQPAAEELKSFQQKGGQVLVCQPCLKKYGLQTTDLTPGLLMATPDNVSASLFDPATRVMSW